jgi:hypothetical protein
VTRPRLTTFRRSGRWYDLVDPFGLATARQLSALNRAGILELVDVGDAEVIDKGEAAYAIERAVRLGALTPRQPRDDEVTA